MAPYRNGNWVHHPLVVCELSQNPNRLYRRKKKLVATAEADGDWDLNISLHERPYRIEALEHATQKGLSESPSEYWRLVGRVWRDSENIRQNRQLWKKMMRRRVLHVTSARRNASDQTPEAVVTSRLTRALACAHTSRASFTLGPKVRSSNSRNDGQSGTENGLHSIFCSTPASAAVARMARPSLGEKIQVAQQKTPTRGNAGHYVLRQKIFRGSKRSKISSPGWYLERE